MIQVYRYKAYNSCFCAAPSEAIIATFGSIDQFETFFGGGAKFGPLPIPSIGRCGVAVIHRGFVAFFGRRWDLSKSLTQNHLRE